MIPVYAIQVKNQLKQGGVLGTHCVWDVHIFRALQLLISSHQYHLFSCIYIHTDTASLWYPLLQ